MKNKKVLLNLNKTFRLFSTCIPVKGSVRSIIYDVTRENFDYIPNGLYEILLDFNGKKIQEIIESYGIEYEKTISEYFEFLIEKEYIFFSELDSLMFPGLSMKFKSPHNISNIIIDISNYVFPYIPKITKQIDALGCGAICLRFVNEKLYDKYFEKTIDLFAKSSCRTLEICIVFNERFVKNDMTKYFDDLCVKNQKIFRIHVFEAPENNFYKLKESVSLMYCYTTKLIVDAPHIISLKNFAVNSQMFTESQSFNTYYSRKMFIDLQGNIRHSPTISYNYGNIIDTTFEEVLSNKNYLSIGTITKDEIKVCKDCEYRYMCVDSRIPQRETDSNIYSFKEKCNYNPYKGEWKNLF